MAMQLGANSALNHTLSILPALLYEMYTLVLGTITAVTHAGDTHHTIHQARSATDCPFLRRLSLPVSVNTAS
jgi:hypothetical protein